VSEGSQQAVLHPIQSQLVSFCVIRSLLANVDGIVDLAQRIKY